MQRGTFGMMRFSKIDGHAREFGMADGPETTDVFFFEAFKEEAEALRRLLPSGIRAAFTPLTIQECAYGLPPSSFISIRTQSVIPHSWAGLLDGLLTRSTGYDHVKAFLEASRRAVPAGYLPLYCSRAVAEPWLVRVSRWAFTGSCGSTSCARTRPSGACTWGRSRAPRRASSSSIRRRRDGEMTAQRSSDGLVRYLPVVL
mgnify:CR=1 FL=1